MKPPPSKIPVVLGLLAATAGVIGLTAVVRRAPEVPAGPLKPQFETPAPQPTPGEFIAPTPPARRLRGPKIPSVTERDVVRAVRLDGETPVLGKELTLKPGQSPQLATLAATMTNLGLGDIRILAVGVDGGVATVDASPKLLDHGFSSTSEATLVNAVATALGQFPGVRTFRFRVDGEVLDTLGHLEMTEPQPVIRPGQKAAGSGGDSGDDGTPSRPPSP